MNHLDDLHSHSMGAGERSGGGRDDRGFTESIEKKRTLLAFGTRTGGARRCRVRQVVVARKAKGGCQRYRRKRTTEKKVRAYITLIDR